MMCGQCSDTTDILKNPKNKRERPLESKTEVYSEPHKCIHNCGNKHSIKDDVFLYEKKCMNRNKQQ